MVWTRGDGRPVAREAASPFDETFIRKLERLALVIRTSGGWLSGEHSTRHRGSSLEFADHRNYVQGDDYRRVDWHVYGRLEEILRQAAA